MVGGADDYVGAKSIYFIRCVNSGVARQKIMADRCARRFGSGLKQSCKLMQQPWANERPVAPSLLITTNLITVTRSRLIVPPVLEKRDASRQIARSNPPPPPPFLARSTIDRYFLLPFHPESNGINIFKRLMSDRYFSSILPRPFERWSTNSFTTISFFHSIERKKKWDFRRRQFLNYASNCAQYPIRSKTSPFRRMRLFLVSFNLPIDELEVFSPPGTLSTTTYSFIFTPIFVSSSVEMFVFYLSFIYIYISMYIFLFTKVARTFLLLVVYLIVDGT